MKQKQKTCFELLSIKNAVSFSGSILIRKTATEYVEVPIFLYLSKKIRKGSNILTSSSIIPISSCFLLLLLLLLYPQGI